MMATIQNVWQLNKTDQPDGVKSALEYPASVTFIVDTYTAVADSEGHRLVILDGNGTVRSVVGNDRIWPNCVALTREGNLAVTDRKDKKVKVFDVQDQCLLEFGAGLLTQPFGIAITSWGQYVVSDISESKIYLFSSEGVLLKEFGSKGKGVSQLHLPFYIAVNIRDEIVVSDNMNYAIKIFDQGGNFKHKIGSGHDFGQRQFRSPYGVAIDEQNRLYVADKDNNKVFVSDGDGGQHQALLVPADGCRSPMGVAVSPLGLLAVTECTPDYTDVKMYEMK